MEVLTHRQEKYGLDDVQQFSSRFSSLLLLRHAHTALLRFGDSLTRTDCSPSVLAMPSRSV